VVAIAIGVTALQLSPARALARLMPEGVRQTLGERTVKSMTAGKPECTAPAGRIAVDRLSQRLAAVAPSGTTFAITVVDWGLVNAFATPGNRIVLTRGLIEKAESPDEVAGVLAHEMGHGIALHPETGIVRSIGLAAAVELMLGGGGGTLSNIGLLLAQLSYTRAAEEEADEVALKMLRDAGISNEGIAAFFRRIEARSPAGDDDGAEPGDKAKPDAEKRNGDAATRTERGRGGLGSMLSTHPATEDRLRRIAAEGRYPATPALAKADWQAMKSMCTAAGTPQ
jgi:predicted Zn-dependent protease